MNASLIHLRKNLRLLILIYLITISCGLGLGLVYLSQNTSFSVKGTVEHFNGSENGNSQDDLDFPEKYPKPVSELLMTTHNHVLGLSFVFLSVSLIFYFSSLVHGFWKRFLMIEPLISVLITFGSIWGIRFVHHNFVYLTILSAILMYSTIFLMIFISAYELIFYKKFK